MLTINLLPPELKNRFQSERFLQSINKIFYPFIILIFILIFVSGYGIYYFKSKNKQIDAQISQKNTDLNQYSETKKNLDLINSNLSVIKQLDIYQVNWPQIFDELAKSLPDRLQLTVLNIDIINTGNVDISGNCDSIDTILNFQKKLEASALFTNVVFISSDKSEKGVNFKLSAKLEKIQTPQSQAPANQTQQNE